MALDVSSSLANSLPSPERASVSSRARAAGSRTSSAGKAPAAADSFGAMVSENAKTENVPVQAKAATLARAKRLMPGQIAGHQDTRVSGGTTTVDAKTGASVAATPVAPQESPAKDDRTSAGAGHKDREPATDAGADAAACEAAPRQADTQGADPAPAGDEQQARSDQGQGEGASKDDRERAALDGVGKTEESETTPDAALAPVPQPPVAAQTEVLAGAAAIGGASTPVQGGEAGAVAPDAGIAAVAPQGISTVTEGSMPIEGGSPVEADKGGNALAQVKAGTSVPDTAMTDTARQSGMSQQSAEHLEATAEEAASKAAASGVEGTGGKGKAEATHSAGAAESARPAGQDGPVLRGAIFSQVLEGFAGTHGLARSHDMLATLDPAVAAHAQSARANDVPRATPLQLLPVEIGMQAVRGAREFMIRLDPAELGRVEVKLHVNDKGEVNASMIVERPETLQMLRRDATTLAQAFEQAGLKQGENSLSFSLKGEGQQGQQQNQQGSAGRASDIDDAALKAQVSELVTRRVMIPNSSLDLMV